MERRLLAAGMAMPVTYFAAFCAAMLLHPGFDLLKQPPSDLGAAGVSQAWVMNAGLLATGAAGAAGALGFALGLRGKAPVTGGLTALSLLMGSVGLAMSGLFPLPNPLHYGFGLTTAAALTPLLGAIALGRASGGWTPTVILLTAFGAIAAAVVTSGPPLIPGAIMFAAVAYLCWTAMQQSARAP